MKRVTLLLMVLGAAGLPLTAAAFDYGSDQRFLAAETGVPPLAGAHGENNPFSDLTHRARAAEDDTPAPPTVDTEKRGASRAPTMHHDAPRRTVTPGPDAILPRPTPGALSWQSLLPGSIQ